MTSFLDIDALRNQLLAPYPSGRTSPTELGDALARLVWESFTDFLVASEFHELLAHLGMASDDGAHTDRIAEELLILHMWAHSRAVQMSFHRRVSEEGIRTALDALHRAIFEDMVANGTPAAQVPVFEQRVSARYSEYNAAAYHSDDRLGEVVLEHLVAAGADRPPRAAQVLTARAIEVADPLRDYLAGVILDEA